MCDRLSTTFQLLNEAIKQVIAGSLGMSLLDLLQKPALRAAKRFATLRER